MLIPIAYSEDDPTADFVSGRTDTTREECDQLARTLLGTDISPVPIQGSFSYTVTNDSRIVQFRGLESPLDIDLLQRARHIHGSLVAETEYHGKIGQNRPLLVYTMEKLSGVTYLEYSLKTGIRSSMDEQHIKRHQNLIKDLARFFAASWKAPQTADKTAMRQLLRRDLRLLAQNLPTRFSREVLAVSTRLDFILDNLPIVLTHGDLCEMNFLVDENSGRLTGVIDWAEAAVRPFGFGLWGLENVLGSMNSSGWRHHDQADELRMVFWDTLFDAIGEDKNVREKQDVINLAVQMGVLLRYGFGWDENGHRQVTQEGESSMRYLDALLMT